MINLIQDSAIVDAIENHIVYVIAFIYVSIYPIFFGLLWIFTALGYFFLKDLGPAAEQLSDDQLPFVSVVIPLHNEAILLKEMLDVIFTLDYPHYEVVMINDGSTDETLALLKNHKNNPKLKIITHEKNEGKASSLNQALPYIKGEIILFLDADALPNRDILRKIVPNFYNTQIGAVTGNPRVRNISNLLSCLQLMEYTSIISLLRRSQHLWGVLMTAAGVVLAVRKSALIAVGGFRPNMQTEDICLTWDLQKNGYKVAYESHAVVWMTVPTRLKAFIKQRMRWARGQCQVLRLHADIFLKKAHRPMILIYMEAVLSLAWSLLFCLFFLGFIFSICFFVHPFNFSLVPLAWGSIIAFTSLLMQFVGIMIERKHDKSIVYFAPYAIFYPLIYWFLISIVAAVNIPRLFFKIPKQKVRWIQEREIL